MSSRCLGFAYKTTVRLEPLRGIDIPVFLCPALLKPGYNFRKKPLRIQEAPFKSSPRLQTRLLHSKSPPTCYEARSDPVGNFMQLPQQCTGCGALSQTLDSQEPGFYSLGRRSVKAFLTGASEPTIAKNSSEYELIEASLQKADVNIVKSLHLDVPVTGEIFPVDFNYMSD